MIRINKCKNFRIKWENETKWRIRRKWRKKNFEKHYNDEINSNIMMIQENRMKKNEGDKGSIPKEWPESNIIPSIERNV